MLASAKVQRTQAKNCEDVGSIDDKGISTNRENCRNGIQGEKQVCRLNDDYDNEEQRRVATSLKLQEEPRPVIAGSHRHELSGKKRTMTFRSGRTSISSFWNPILIPVKIRKIPNR